MHPELLSELQKSGLTPNAPPATTAEWQDFLKRIKPRFDPATSNTEPECPENDWEFRRIVVERNRLRSILLSLSDAICVFGHKGNLLFMNPAAHNYLDIPVGKWTSRYDGEQILSHLHIHDKWQPDQFLSVGSVLRMIKEGKAIQDMDAQLQIAKADEYLPIACVITPMYKDEHVIGAVLVFRDTSEHQRVSAALLAAKEDAEKASAAKSDFLSSMSHELRTPMNAILGYGEMLEEELGDPPCQIDPDYLEDVQTYVGNILQAGKNLLQLINEVLDLTRIETGKIELNIGKANVVDVMRCCIETIQAQLGQLNLTLDTSGIPDQEIYALADAERLQQVVGQILSNAVKHNRANGSIAVRVERPSVEQVKILVSDTGVGMSSEQQKQVFKPFMRISGRNLTKGTGVGLTIAKQLLEIMDGRMGLDSTLDVGTTFWIELPTGETAETLAHDKNDVSDRKYLFLYVEDSRTNVTLMSKILRERPDIAFISAPTGEMGLELARAHRPDIILLDINLPGISGFEVLKQLREQPVTRDIPVMGLSADDSSDALQRAKTAGFSQYMIKPLKKDQFLVALKGIID